MQTVQPTSISIIIPTRNQHELLSRLVDGLLETAQYGLAKKVDVELLIMNNQSYEHSTLQYLSWLKNSDQTHPFKRIRCIDYPFKFNYSAINNKAAELCSTEYLCFMNNDIEVMQPNWLEHMLYECQQPDVGCVGAMLYYPDNTIQHAGVAIGLEKVAGHIYKNTARGEVGFNGYLQSTQHVSAVTGACMLLKTDVFWHIGGFDEKLAVAFNDVDLCLRAKAAGLRNLWTPKAELVHHESKSRGESKQRSWAQRLRHKQELLYMQNKWKESLQQDSLQQGAVTHYKQNLAGL